MDKAAYQTIVDQLSEMTSAEFEQHCSLVRPEDCTDEYLAALLYVNDSNGDYDELSRDDLLSLFASEIGV